ncbi:putative NPN-dependent ornithine cyclodeaminase [Desulfogranum mediterraneum]|uniref:ornithine cyclodeaminase family domain n=1 Tax=Desulfogranum mediterraneum TaxID=160661 RepID=UPI00040B873F|nr:hypothetical protein [Desulfogranum mediterraneum]
MNFSLPGYTPPDFSTPRLSTAPTATFTPVRRHGVAPEGYHATTVFPEYFQLSPGQWVLAARSRMDCVVVLAEKELLVKEFRNLRQGDLVAVGRSENGEQGIYVHTQGFAGPDQLDDKFAFRSNRTRETSFSIDYDQLYQLLDHERDQGFIVWVLGPAVTFDHDAREAFSRLIKLGYVHALLAGNALATHDLEGSLFETALGQELYHKRAVADGHYHHLDTLNTIRRAGSIQAAIDQELITEGIMHSLVCSGVPYVLAGSIRDDGPLPEIFGDVYQAQDAMRRYTSQATTVIALATQLHTIAAGNMTPSYTLTPQGQVRPVYFYSVDMSEFAVNKLSDRGSLTAKSILTNAQDFMVTLLRGLRERAS